MAARGGESDAKGGENNVKHKNYKNECVRVWQSKWKVEARGSLRQRLLRDASQNVFCTHSLKSVV